MWTAISGRQVCIDSTHLGMEELCPSVSHMAWWPKRPKFIAFTLLWLWPKKIQKCVPKNRLDLSSQATTTTVGYTAGQSHAAAASDRAAGPTGCCCRGTSRAPLEALRTEHWRVPPLAGHPSRNLARHPPEGASRKLSWCHVYLTDLKIKITCWKSHPIGTPNYLLEICTWFLSLRILLLDRWVTQWKIAGLPNRVWPGYRIVAVNGLQIEGIGCTKEITQQDLNCSPVSPKKKVHFSTIGKT